MPEDDDISRRMRQEMLEAVTCGMGGPLLAPMPGVLLETLEIAALERWRGSAEAAAQAGETQTLTAAQNGSGITAKFRRAFKAIARAAQRVASGFGRWRLPA